MGLVACEGCGKPLIERLPNGIWRFRYGREKYDQYMVNIDIHGSLKLVCWRKKCRHVNILHYFPGTYEINQATSPEL